MQVDGMIWRHVCASHEVSGHVASGTCVWVRLCVCVCRLHLLFSGLSFRSGVPQILCICYMHGAQEMHLLDEDIRQPQKKLVPTCLKEELRGLLAPSAES